VFTIKYVCAKFSRFTAYRYLRLWFWFKHILLKSINRDWETGKAYIYPSPNTNVWDCKSTMTSTHLMSSQKARHEIDHSIDCNKLKVYTSKIKFLY
jgi:hypothetical protein